MKLNKRDWLSSLPVEILLEILSLLPITTAITTSVLSHRWHHLWTQLTAVRFTKDTFRNPTKHNFFNIIDHIITRQLISPLIHTFHLHLPDSPWGQYNIVDYQETCSFYLNAWVILICGRGVREIKVSSGFDLQVQPPACLFDSPSLVVLDLSSGFRFSLPSSGGVSYSISLCYLAKLHLHLYLYDGDCELMEMLFKSCTSLEDLALDIGSKSSYFRLDRPFQLDIRGPKLKRLSLFLGNIWCRTLQGPRVTIGAPNLEYFGVSDLNESGYTFVKPSSVLIEADIWFRKASKIFPAIFNFRKLTLHYDTLGAGKLMDHYDGTLLVYRNLTSLSTHFRGTWDDLMRQLKRTPNLEVLELKLQLLETANELSNIPNCLPTKIKKVTLLNLNGTKLEVKLIRYLLRCARDLEMLDISMCKRQNEMAQLHEETKFCRGLSRLSGHLPNCKVRFIFGSKEVDEHVQHVLMRWNKSLVFPSQELKVEALKYFRRKNWDRELENLRK